MMYTFAQLVTCNALLPLLCGVNIMTTRERALDWWQGITYRNLLASANIPNFRGRDASSLTGREIEIIWRRCGNAT